MKVKRMTLCALFAALTAVCAQIVIPIGQVPASLALLPVLLCAALLPPRYAVTSAAVYLAMGLIGLPVFARMTGGPGVLWGPTGGFLVGYVACAGITALLRAKRLPLSLAMACGTAACYACGTLWLIVVAHMKPAQALLSGVVPFLAGDALKIAVAHILAQRLTIVMR